MPGDAPAGGPQDGLEFAGKVVLISGGARGQGLSHGRLFAARGAHVVLVDACADLSSVPYPMPAPAELDAAAARLRDLGPGQVLAYRADVRDSAALGAAVEDAAGRLGGVDIVLGNAGVFSFAATSWELTEEQWRDCVDVNLFGCWNLARLAIPRMLGRPGANIVFTGSVSAHKGIAATGHYVAAKHGLVGLMRTLAVELAPHGVRVNLVSPTAVDTTMANNPAMAECVKHQESGGTVMSNLLPVELLNPADVSEAIAWVASARGRHMTGTCLRIDAGFLTR